MKIHYLEIVTPMLEETCAAYAGTNGVQFGEPEPLLGNARTATLADGSIVGVRKPLHESEDPVVRPYCLVDDIQSSVKKAIACGAEIAHPPLEIPGKGTFAIYIVGGVHHGLWQL